jgi:hypothetical protein
LDAGAEALASPLILEERLYLLHHLTLRSFQRGDLAEYHRHLADAAATPCAAFWDDLWLHRHFLFPILERELGDSDACERSARHVIANLPLHCRAKPLHLARFVLGEITLSDFEAQPVRLFMRPRSLLARALRAEYTQDRATAARFYCDYLSLPAQDHFSESSRGDPLVDHWALLRARDH